MTRSADTHTDRKELKLRRRRRKSDLIAEDQRRRNLTLFRFIKTFCFCWLDNSRIRKQMLFLRKWSFNVPQFFFTSFVLRRRIFTGSRNTRRDRTTLAGSFCFLVWKCNPAFNCRKVSLSVLRPKLCLRNSCGKAKLLRRLFVGKNFRSSSAHLEERAAA